MAKMKVTRLCAFCANPFTPWTGNAGRYCSQECYHAYRAPLSETFWAKVQKTDGCWLWTAGTNKHGYGKYLQTSAHRASWEIHFGAIPSNLCVLHRCDNPPCVRPEHLFLGTDADNMTDRLAKGRYDRGEDHPMALLTERCVKEIRSLYSSGAHTLMSLAIQYGVAQSTIHAVVKRKVWKHC